ncbi:DUF2167 domain-containing protein [Roseovarius phycicola]|uniref:DUF2167 domain-containing protein n=1 Tax=Roseovarius phycicola TaxID=3080976 RepID=A0ABZ2HLY2_9RHOB
MYFKQLCCGAILATCVSSAAFAISVKEAYPDQYSLETPEWQAVLDTIDLKQGVQNLPRVTLDVPDDYYFVNSKDAETILHDIWGNPPGDFVLGMLFHKDGYFIENWGVEVFYEDTGYVSDSDAADMDYDALLANLRSDMQSENKWREQNGYERIELLGWAEPPHYEAEEHKLYWAKELAFEGYETNVLNYNIRVLGREGVLVLNFIADIENLAEVKSAAPDVLDMPSFTPGNTYADFNPSTDAVAAYGIGGLIAGKAAAKTGLLAAGVLLLKKFWFVLLIPLIGLKNVIFGRRA